LKLSDRQLLAIVNAEFSTAMGAPGGEISTERAKAWDYYMSKPLGNEIEGQSQVVSSDVAEVVDSLMPQLLRMFTPSDNLIQFDPVGPEDEPLAAQESDYTSHVFFKQNDSFMLLYTWFFDALAQKNGYVKAFVDESEVITTETYNNLTEPELYALMDDEELEAIERSEPRIEEIDGIPVELHDVEFRRVCKKKKFRVENIPPEEMRVSSDARSLDLSKCRMVGQETTKKRSELLEMGFDKDVVANLPADLEINSSSEEIARYDRTDEHSGVSHDKSQDEITLREVYIRVDFDGDGRSELRQVFIAGNTLLANEPADRQPFHVLSPKPLPHKHFGRAKAEDVMDIQQISTTLERQALDNLYLTNNPEINVWEQAIGEDTMDDLLTRRAGSINRFARPVGESWAPNIIPFTAQASFGVLDYYDKKIRDRTGIASDAEGLSPDSLKNIQQSVLTQALDQGKMKIEAVARIFAETGLKSLFLHIHELLLKHQDKEAVVKLRGEWIQVDPSSWRSREDVTIGIGLGIGSREQNLLHLNALWEKQVQALGIGGTSFIKPVNLYNTAKEIAKNANLKNTEMFLTDPGDAEFGQSDEQAALQQQQQQLLQRQQELDAQKQQLDQMGLMLKQEKQSGDMELRMAEFERKVEKDKDDLTIAMEKIANELTEMELKYPDGDEVSDIRADFVYDPESGQIVAAG
jgi:hypothetical protein